MKRLIRALRRWWHGDNHGTHARPRGDTFDLTQATIPRRQTMNRPPWDTDTGQFPAICLLPAHVPDPAPLHRIVQAQLGAASVAEYIDNLFGHLAAA